MASTLYTTNPLALDPAAITRLGADFYLYNLRGFTTEKLIADIEAIALDFTNVRPGRKEYNRRTLLMKLYSAIADEITLRDMLGAGA